MELMYVLLMLASIAMLWVVWIATGAEGSRFGKNHIFTMMLLFSSAPMGLSFFAGNVYSAMTTIEDLSAFCKNTENIDERTKKCFVESMAIQFDELSGDVTYQ